MPVILVATALLVWLGLGPLRSLLKGEEEDQAPVPAVVESPSETFEELPPEPQAEPPDEFPVEPTVEPPALPEGTVPFHSANSPTELNPDLTWSLGGSADSAYDLDESGDTLTIVAGPNTMNWNDVVTAPMILYDVSGDFSAQVRVSSGSVPLHHTGYGLGVRSKSDHTTWLEVVQSQDLFAFKNIGGTVRSVGNVSYSDTVVHLRIERTADRFTISYSPDGEAWIRMRSNEELPLSGDAELYLLTYANGSPVEAQFSEFRVNG